MSVLIDSFLKSIFQATSEVCSYLQTRSLSSEWSPFHCAAKPNTTQASVNLLIRWLVSMGKASFARLPTKSTKGSPRWIPASEQPSRLLYPQSIRPTGRLVHAAKDPNEQVRFGQPCRGGHEQTDCCVCLGSPKGPEESPSTLHRRPDRR